MTADFAIFTTSVCFQGQRRTSNESYFESFRNLDNICVQGHGVIRGLLWKVFGILRTSVCLKWQGDTKTTVNIFGHIIIIIIIFFYSASKTII